jgi:cytoskeletal protein RodZ
VSVPRIKASTASENEVRKRARGARGPKKGDVVMWLILLEAAVALLILVLIVWWTMFSGRKSGERHHVPDDGKDKP